MTPEPPIHADTKIKSSAPWIELDDDGGILCGNHAGLELLAGAIGEILKGEETAINLDGYDVCFQRIQLQERGIDPPPPESMVLRIVAYFFLVLLVGILGTSAFGTYQLFHFIFSN